MNPSPLFSSGLLELGSFVVTSNVLHDSWAAISKLNNKITEASSSAFSVRSGTFEQPNCTIIAFVTWPPCTKAHLQEEGRGDLVSSSTLKETFPLFEFQFTKTKPCFSINKPAINLFDSIRGELETCKFPIFDSKPLIITGNSLGGSVASLVTLWLLNTIDLATTRRPLCITFGSPLIGDDGLQEAILQYSTWNSSFLHVVSNQDPVPRVLRSPQNPTALESACPTNEYKPFGMFLLCSELGCASLEDPESILELLMKTYSEGPRNRNPNQVFEYGNIVQQLTSKVICKDSTEVNEWMSQPLQAGIITQRVAIGLGRPQSIDMDTLIKKIERQERKLLMGKREVFDPDVLNNMKVNMALLEWYKKCSEGKGIGYYDCYKNASDRSDLDVEKFKKSLTCYWIDIVNEVEKKLQRKDAALTTWLFAGSNYRKMIEPLDIAEYYKADDKTDYKTKGRSEHYKQLEKWLSQYENAASRPNNSKKQKLKGGLTEDSCFWAYVEEARISCKVLINRESNDIMEKHKGILVEFEAYVLGMINNCAVSPEIFLQQSSFIKWWKDYLEIIREGIMGTSYSSPLTEFMNNPQCRRQYTTAFL